MKLLTFLPLEQINEMEKWEGSQLNQAKEILAYELTNLVHGEEEAKKAQEGARALFGTGASATVPETIIEETDLTDDGMDLIGVLVKAELAPTRSDARRAIEQGGVTVDEEKITDVKAVLTKAQLEGEGVLIRRGKKKFKRVHM